MDGARLYQVMSKNHFSLFWKARDTNDKYTLEATSGNDTWTIAFFDYLIEEEDVSFRVRAFAARDDSNGNRKFVALCRPHLTSSEYFIFEYSVKDHTYSFLGEDAYKMFSFVARHYANEHNGVFPDTFPYRHLHPEHK